MSNNKLKDTGFSDAIANVGANVLEKFKGVFSALPVAKYASGARCKIKVNGKLVGFAFGVSWHVETSVTEVRTIDEYNAWELAPKHVKVSGTLSLLHIPGEGPSASLHQSNVLNFLQQKYITIEVRDQQTDNLLFFTNKAMVTSRVENLRAEQLGDITLTWQAVGWKDEKEPVAPKDWGASSKDAQQALQEKLKSIEEKYAAKRRNLGF